MHADGTIKSAGEKLDGQDFVNSSTCSGTAYVAQAPLDMSLIRISGRYPESGWARNRECHEVVYIQSGNGRLEFAEGKTINLQQGDVVHVNPGHAFAWSGQIDLIMACSPAFTANQYELIAESAKEKE